MELVGPIFLILAWLFGVLLARRNLRVLRETRQERLEARRAFKKKKNEGLRIYYGLKKDD